MAPYSTRYKFSQRFNMPAREAYSWCTDFQPEDVSLMGMKGRRSIRHISENAVVLTDRIYRDGSSFSKRRLVLLYPERLSWINTHLAGPNKHSQFLYEIIPEGKKASHLDFTGFQISYDIAGSATPEKIESLAKKLRDEDSDTWKRFARVMEMDTKKNPGRWR